MSKPIRGLILGILLGLGIAIVLQQAGVWPLDRLLVFGMAGVFGLVGILMTHVGGTLESRWPMLISVILALALVGIAATGLAEINETGELNGGCTVDAMSDIDTTVVTDTSRRDPFDIDPNGSLSWVAVSPGPIMDHEWEIWVDVGGFPIVVASGGDPNTDGDVENVGSIEVAGAIDELEVLSAEQIQGIYMVGGFIEGTQACDGFAFVRVGEGWLDTYLSWIGAALALLALLFLLITMISNLRGAGDEVVVVEDDEATSAIAGSGAAGGLSSDEAGRHMAPPPTPEDDEGDLGPDRRDDM